MKSLCLESRTASVHQQYSVLALIGTQCKKHRSLAFIYQKDPKGIFSLQAVGCRAPRQRSRSNAPKRPGAEGPVKITESHTQNTTGSTGSIAKQHACANGQECTSVVQHPVRGAASDPYAKHKRRLWVRIFVFFFCRPGSLPWFLQLKSLICCIV